jgi:hypothetical protein
LAVGHGACSVLVPIKFQRMIKNGTERAMNRWLFSHA